VVLASRKQGFWMF